MRPGFQSRLQLQRRPRQAVAVTVTLCRDFPVSRPKLRERHSIKVIVLRCGDHPNSGHTRMGWRKKVAGIQCNNRGNDTKLNKFTCRQFFIGRFQCARCSASLQNVAIHKRATLMATKSSAKLCAAGTQYQRHIDTASNRQITACARAETSAILPEGQNLPGFSSVFPPGQKRRVIQRHQTVCTTHGKVKRLLKPHPKWEHWHFNTGRLRDVVNQHIANCQGQRIHGTCRAHAETPV